MVMVHRLIWNEWNKRHIARHNILPEEVEEACHNSKIIVESYRKRLLLIGKTKSGKTLAVVLSPEDVQLKPYGKGIYYVITAFEKEEQYGQ